jgi:hypothetical protein
MDSQTPWLDDPQCPFGRSRIEYSEEFSYAIEHACMGGPRPDFEYHYAGGGGGRVTKHLPKIAIQCDERSAFPHAHFEQCLVRRPPRSP